MRFIKNRREKIGAAILYGFIAIVLAALTSCATKPPAPASEIPDYHAMVSLRPESSAINLTSTDTAHFEFVLALENKSPVDFFQKTIEQTLEIDGSVVENILLEKPGIGLGTLPAFGELSSTFSNDRIKLSAIPPSAFGGVSQPESVWRLTTTVVLEDHDGKAWPVSLETSGTFTRVIVPTLAIESITVRKMELINTKLKVDIAVRNENRFPLTLNAFEYALFGEGRFWARGKTGQDIVVDAQSDKKIALELVMNFADMDRSILDRVIHMKQVACRLSGTIRLQTGLQFLPQFDLPFSVESEAPVSR